jgi:hypothetical protein
VILLLLEPFLNDFGPRNDPFFHFFHDFILYLDSGVVVRDSFRRREPSFLQERPQIVIGVILIDFLLNFVSILLKFLARLVIQSLINGEDSVSHLFIFLGSESFFVSNRLIALLLHRE